MQIVTLYGTRSAVASGKSLYRVEMSVGSLIYARDLLHVAWVNPLVSYPILDTWHCCDSSSSKIGSEMAASCRERFP